MTSNKISWVAWDKILCERSKGGLGICSLRALNLAMLGKWWWRERIEADVKWNTVVKLCKSSSGRNGNKRSIWNVIKSIDGDLIALGINLQNFLHLKTDGSGWEWSLDASKSYTVRSLRALIDNRLLPVTDTVTEWINWIPRKANIHLWRTLCNRLATKGNLGKHGVMLQSLECQLCYASEESLDHIMTACSATRLVSAYISSWVKWWPVTVPSTQSLWTAICNSDGKQRADEKVVMKVIGVAFLWFMWRTRNNKVFNGTLMKEKEIFENIQFLAFDWIRNRFKYGNLMSWDNWICDPTKVIALCNPLTPC